MTWRTRGIVALALIVVALALPTLPTARAGIATKCADCRFDFGKAVAGKRVEHAFVLRNTGEMPLRIAGVQLSPPLQLTKMPAVIPAKGSATLKLSLDTSGLEGDFSGDLIVLLDGAVAAPRVFSLSGKIIPSIEILPRPAFFISTRKGVAKSASLEIINHGAHPLELKLSPQVAARLGLRLQSVEKGKRYLLSLTIPATAAAGRKSERLQLQTSNADQPVLHVGINTTVRERVYTFPDSIDFGRLTMRELASPSAAQTGAVQTLMVYQQGGKDFSARARSSTPAIGLGVEVGPKRDRAEVTVSLIPSKLKPGTIRGTVTVQTNDREFPTLTVPVTGEIVAD